MSKIPYSEKSDLEKIKSNWNKTKGLYESEEWSASIERVATAVEIAANLVIREELITNHNLDPNFVDSLLKWANGIQGKNILIKVSAAFCSTRILHWNNL